jgi:hypothetical protein
MKKHPWRKCTSGYHWRKASYVDRHARRGRAVKGHVRRSTCVRNSSHKDQIYPEEMEFISQKYFNLAKLKISLSDLGFGEKGTKFDHLITGWTQYWNEVLKPSPKLNPKFVKALMASESGFRSSISNYANKRSGYARGLLQVMDQTVRILKDEKGELRDLCWRLILSVLTGKFCH